MSNVIDFNAVKMKRMQKRLDDLVEEHEYVEELAADFAISAVMDIVEASSEFGFDVMENPDVIRDMLATVESIRSIIHRIAGDRIEFHNISDRMFDNIENTEVALKNFLTEFSE
jgi:hypothetical protein